MVTLHGANKEAGRRERDVERAVQAVTDARAAVGQARRTGAKSHEIKAAEARVRLAALNETRARDALKHAREAVERVAAHEQEFERLASIAAAIAQKDAALTALGLETRGRIEAELVEIRSLIEDANKVLQGLPVDVVTVLQLPPPASIARRWTGLAPGADLLAVLSQATAAAAGGQ